ncbi:hypothetical protein ACEPPN_014339 [Leptodophora sp. 'Broadleaf-Isolate-01']
MASKRSNHEPISEEKKAKLRAKRCNTVPGLTSRLNSIVPPNRTALVSGPRATAVTFAVDRERDGIKQAAAFLPVLPAWSLVPLDGTNTITTTSNTNTGSDAVQTQTPAAYKAEEAEVEPVQEKKKKKKGRMTRREKNRLRKAVGVEMGGGAGGEGADGEMDV